LAPVDDVQTRPTDMPTVLALGCPDDEFLVWGLLASEADLLLRLVDLAGVEMIATTCRPVAVMVLDELYDLDPSRFAQIEASSGAVIVRVQNFRREKYALRSALCAARSLWLKRREPAAPK
jgi:hypothetical protein